jgi:hypothetical protein
MIPKTLRLFCLHGLALLLPLSATAKQPSLTTALPDGALGFVEFSDLGEVVRSVRESRALQWLMATDEYQKFEQSPDYRKVNAVRATAELMLGGSLWDAASDLFGGRTALALYPDPANYRQPQAVVIFRPEESKTFTKVREALKPLLSAAGKDTDTSGQCPGTTTWSFDGKGYVTMHGSWLLAAPQRPLLDRALALLNGAKDQPSLAAQTGISEMERGLGADHHVRAWVDTALVRKGLGERFGLPEKATNGAASFIFGGLLELAARSPFAAGALDFRDREVTGTLCLAGDPAKLPEPGGLWYVQHPGNGVIPLPKTPGTIAGITIHRKLGDWYRHRDKLLADHLLPAFDKFETDIGNLLPQKDFGQDVLPLIGDNFTLTAALQNYDHLDGQPGIKLPAFAAIFDLPQPKDGADTFQLFFQTLSAILNLQAGQEGRQPSVLDAEFYKETKISFSRFLDKPKGDRLAIAYNFQPAAATVGRKYIIATSVQYCRDLVDHFKNPESSQWQNRNSEMALDFATLAKLAEMNEGLLRSQDIQKGQTPAAAEKRIGLLLSVLRQLDQLRYHSTADQGLFKMSLSATWK